MQQEITPLLRAARERGCRTQVGTDMLFEQIPLYLEFFGFGARDARRVAGRCRARTEAVSRCSIWPASP